MTIYSTREEGLNAFVEACRPIFEAVGTPIPFNVRCSIGWPTTGSDSKAIAEIVHHAASGDGHFEIFVSPANFTDVEVFAALTHELIHAAVGLEARHSKTFGKPARALGLDGKLTATTPGSEWFKWATPIVESITMPYAPIDMQKGKIIRRKKATSLKPVKCPSCGWLAQVSACHVTPYTHLNCPVPDCDGVMTCDHWGDPNDDGEGGWQD